MILPLIEAREQGEARPGDFWVVYDHPKDFPYCFVARRWDGFAPTSQYILAARLKIIRHILQDMGCRLRFPREDGDDAAILEMWI